MKCLEPACFCIYADLVLALIYILLVTNAWSYFDYSSTPGKPAEMNGIKYDQYKEFTKNWHLVTVRYRLDTKELRFVYANESAWTEMSSLSPKYPDGASFAKVAFVTEVDPAFTSSVGPSGSRRIQIMVKDQKKYSESDGWGYALFDSNGQLFKEDIKSKTLSCVACHRIVPERDFVFSRPVQLPGQSEILKIAHSGKANKQIFFNQGKLEDIPRSLLPELDANTKAVQLAEGEIKNHAFSGTLDEVVPLLIEQTALTHQPTLFLVDKKNLTFVMPSKSDSCASFSQKNYHVVLIYNGKKVRDAEVCQ